MKKSTREVRLSVNNSTIQFKTVYTICGYLITFEQREKCEQQRHLRLLFTRLSCRKNMAGASSLTFNQANRQLTFLDVFHTLPLSIFFFFHRHSKLLLRKFIRSSPSSGPLFSTREIVGILAKRNLLNRIFHANCFAHNILIQSVLQEHRYV